MAQTRIGWIALALATSSMAWAEPPALDRWARARSPHFTVITDGPARDAEHLAQRFERLRLVFGRLWPTARLDGRQVVVVAPVGPAGLAPLLPPHWTGENTIHPAGLMVAGLDRVYLAMRADQDPHAVYSVAIHEYVHLLVETNLPAAPLWLNEGLAEFYAAGRLEDNPAVFGLPHAGHLSVLRARAWLPLDTLLSTTRGSAVVGERGSSAAFYAQAWLLVHYLKLADGGRYAAQLTTFTARVAQGVPAPRAALEAFGNLAQLSRRLAAYARGGRFYDARFPMDAADVGDAGKGEPLAPWQAAVALGDFLTHVQAFDQASQLLARAAELAPDEAEVHERHALLALQQQRPDEALGAAEHALSLGHGPHPLSHFLRAVALLASGSNLTSASTRDAESELRRAIVESPTLAPAYTTLGGLLAARDGVSPEALALIERAIALDPSAVSHQVTLGQVLLMSGDAAEAQRVAERARATARTATERETVERLLAATLGAANRPN
jgi:tetratricopeptide (TPR) repeat protein